LGDDADDEEVGQLQGVVSYDGVLEGSDYGYGCVERVAEAEIPD
jgi:hypothetical protein